MNPALLLLLAATAVSPVPDAAVQSIVHTQITAHHIPSAAVEVIQGGRVVYADADGLANVAGNVAATADTAYEIGSDTKQFTAMLVMMEVEARKMSLDTGIGAYVPGLPAAWRPISVRRLLAHTSGIPNYTAHTDTRRLFSSQMSEQQVIAIVAKLPLDFKPGALFQYSNTNYFVLGMALEHVTGLHYFELLRRRVLAPLGMSHTFASDPLHAPATEATGYRQGAGGPEPAPWLNASVAGGAGELVSTVGDMAKWDAALDRRQFLSPSGYRAMWTSGRLSTGSETHYAFGWLIGFVSGHRIIAHDGGTGGFSCSYARFPDDHLSVVVLTNSAGADAGAIVQAVAAHYDSALAPHPDNPIHDPDPATSARIRRIVDEMIDGRAQRSDYTSTAAGLLFPDRAKQAAESLRALGALKSFELLARVKDGANMLFRYRATFASVTLTCTVETDPAGKVGTLLFAQN